MHVPAIFIHVQKVKQKLTTVYWCRASSSACGEGVCATIGDNPADFNASAVVGPIAATYNLMYMYVVCEPTHFKVHRTGIVTA